ncbi:alanine racemase [Marivita sp.]|uniref:alanine racemase n=1 Tax=Marivita sp. TaxID=2003365 RepID=UPI003F6D4EBD
MSDLLPSSWCEIHLDRVSRNLELTHRLLPKGTSLCAVMKADAYGHGIDRVVPLLIEHGVTRIGITSNAEARAVRRAGFTGRLFRLRAASLLEVEGALADRVEEQVGSLRAARQMRDLFDAGRATVGVHLSLNAQGMSRDGLEISTKAGQRDCRNIVRDIGAHIIGICTHFPSNEPARLEHSADLFTEQVAWVCANTGLQRADLLVHAGSSLTLLLGAQIETDMYRCGAILYGVLNPELGFRPTMEIKSRVVHIGEYPKGATVGYDCDHVLSEDRRLACVSIGYAAGYSRVAQGRGSVLIRGQVAPVLGKVSMNSIVADVTDIPEAQVEDDATLFGTDGTACLGPSDAVAQFGTILPDLFADWGARNPKVYR